MKYFKDVEEMKWHYHRKYVKNTADWIAFYLMEHTHNIEEANEALATYDSYYRVREEAEKEEEKKDGSDSS